MLWSVPCGVLILWCFLSQFVGIFCDWWIVFGFSYRLCLLDGRVKSVWFRKYCLYFPSHDSCWMFAFGVIMEFLLIKICFCFWIYLLLSFYNLWNYILINILYWFGQFFYQNIDYSALISYLFINTKI